MTNEMAGHPSVRGAEKLALVICLAASTLVVAAGPSSAGRIRCPAQDPCTGTNKGDHMIGTRGSDVILGLDGVSDLLSGRKGNDELRGGRGIDRVRGGRGHDVLGIGPNQEDSIPYDYREYLEGGPGHDVMYGNGGLSIFSGDGGNDTMYGRDGRDDYLYTSPDWGHDVIVDLPDADWHNILWLSSFYDDLVIDLNSSGDHHEMRTADGSATVDWDNDAITFVLGGYGDDIIHGNELGNLIQVQGNDTVYGGEGNDDLGAVDWEGNATIYGGGGDNVINVHDAIHPHDGGFDTVDCGAGDADTVYFDPNDTVVKCEILNP